MKGIDIDKPLWQLTVGEFLELQKPVLATLEVCESSPEEDELLTPTQAAEMLDVGKTTLWRWQKKAYLKPIKIGGILRYRKSDVQKLFTKTQ